MNGCGRNSCGSQWLQCATIACALALTLPTFARTRPVHEHAPECMTMQTCRVRLARHRTPAGRVCGVGCLVVGGGVGSGFGVGGWVWLVGFWGRFLVVSRLCRHVSHFVWPVLHSKLTVCGHMSICGARRGSEVVSKAAASLVERRRPRKWSIGAYRSVCALRTI